MQKQQRLMGLLVVIIVAIGVAITNERSASVDGTGTSSVVQERAPSATRSPRTSTPATTSEQSSTTARRTPTSTAGAAPEHQFDDIATISINQLPPEARQTIALIQQDGPFPYEKDGAIFRNREGVLPPQLNGYYREYTVETPGSNDRGARRIVAGQNGELFYTDDHYESFSRIR